ncbi:MAG: hypothetical protein J1F38_02385 [Muribaculaceae bacterium]|nr:hypothetical protein [Muribaculaceae bacterium]
MILELKKIYIASILLLFLIFLGGCAVNDGVEDNILGNDSEMLFRAYTGAEEGVDTRALTLYDVKSSVYSKANFNVFVQGEDMEENLKDELSTYIVPSGADGILLPAENSRPANWFSRKGLHNVWVWTMPWDNNRYYNPPGEEDSEPTAKTSIDDEITIEFRDTDITELTSGSSSAFQEGSWANGEALKLGISDFNGPVRYADKGQFVSLQFRHMFSAILLGEFNIVDNSTATSVSGLKANIYLYGMPKTATLYTHPVDEEGNPVRPYVKMDPSHDYKQDEYVKFAIPSSTKAFYNDYNSSVYNTLKSNYYFYAHWFICPEVDLSKLSFKLELYEYDTTHGWRKSNKYGENGAFYGDFSNIQISRTPGSNYDLGDDETVLHAGEYLILGFNISTKGNPSIMGSIVDWAKAQDRGASNFKEDGIYSMAEAQDFCSTMNSGDRDLIDEYFGVYGSAERTSDNPDDPFYDKDLGIFKLYEDLGYTGTGQGTTTGSSAKMGNLYVADGYILDGMGHMVNMSTSAPKIGPCRDIYLRSYTASYRTDTGEYFYYENIIYIDSAGEVWKVDPVTYEKTDTGNNIKNAKSNPFTLSLSTGNIS